MNENNSQKQADHEVKPKFQHKSKASDQRSTGGGLVGDFT